MTSSKQQTHQIERTMSAARAIVALGLVVAASATAAHQTQHSGHACSNARTITVNPPTLLDPTPFGYKHITLDTQNAVAYVAGQVAFSLGGQIVGTTLNEQLVLTEQNLRFALSALGADVQDIMRMNVFVKDFQQSPSVTRTGTTVSGVLQFRPTSGNTGSGLHRPGRPTPARPGLHYIDHVNRQVRPSTGAEVVPTPHA